MSPSNDSTFPLYPMCSFLGFLLALIPLPWHAQAWNSGTCSFMIWTAVANLNLFVNSLVWKGNVENPSPVWCDISSKLYIGVSLGIPAAVLCISRRLYSLLALRASSITQADKRKMVIADLCISVGIPVLGMVLHYVVQGHRFDILEDIGCFPSVYNVTLAYPLYLIWAPLLAIISFVYSALTLRAFWRRRAQFASLANVNGGVSVSRYFRLMTLASVDIFLNLPLGIFVIWIGARGNGPAPWISWEDTHYNFSRVERIPAVLWRRDEALALSIQLTRWLPVVCSFIFFGLFGFASEAMKNYRKAFWAVVGLLGIEPTTSSTARKSLLPSWVRAPKPEDVTSSSSSSSTKKGSHTPVKMTSSFASCESTLTEADLELYHYKNMDKALPHSPPRYCASPNPFDAPSSPTSMTSSFADTATLRDEPCSEGRRDSCGSGTQHSSNTSHPIRRSLSPTLPRPTPPPAVYSTIQSQPGTLRRFDGN